jgi:hypothetical protein
MEVFCRFSFIEKGLTLRTGLLFIFAVRSSLFDFLYFSYTSWVKVLTLSLEKTWASKSTLSPQGKIKK